jgi:5'-nucleotidase
MRRLVLLTAFITSCGELAVDDFEEAVSSDLGGMSDATAEACSVLRLAREASQDVLDHEVKLDSRAARNIVATRATVYFKDLETLDRVPHVGTAAFRKLKRFASHDLATWGCGVIDVQLLATNDFHGNLKPPSGSSGRIINGPDPAVNRVDAGGAEYLSSQILKRSLDNPNTVTVAAGDIIGASPLLSALFHDEPTIESMNAIGLDVAAVGNHEFDEGPAELRRMQDGGCHPIDGCQDGDDFGGAEFQYLAANVVEAESGENFFPPYTIRAFRGARIAFIGMTLEATPTVVTPSGVAGLTFGDEVDTVAALLPALAEEKVNAIVVLLHEGGFATGLYNECAGVSGPIFDIAARMDPAVDVIVSGHTNASHVCELNGRLVTSAASFGRLVTDIDLSIDEVTGEVTAKRAENVIVTRDIAKDPAQTALIAKYDAIAAPRANRIVATIAGDLTRAANPAGESVLGNAIADAQLAAAAPVAKGGAVIALMNPGGIRTDILHAQISGGEQAGEVTYGEAFAVQPFGNILTVITLTGAQLDAVLEQQWSMVNGVEKTMILAVSTGFTYEWDPAAPIGSRAGNVALNGAPIDPSATYRITCNNFLADGGDGFTVLKEGTDRIGGDLDLDALEAWLAAGSPVVAPAQNRVRRLGQ